MTGVPGSTKACAAHGDAAFFATLQAYYGLGGEAARKAGGRFIKAMGDAMLLTFLPEPAAPAVAALRELHERGTALWRAFDERCRVQVKGRLGTVLAGPLGPPGEERYDVIGDALNMMVKAPWQDFDVVTEG